ncbi:unnamed protein product [Ranitomeya imitator]|uniref:BRCA1-A complex subunit RAP80 n=1 Tax=Ranitomeya imitator TaxID=111125 RepID=A0ABN9LMM0_9NEOB|nr:unnamed protein product [Ranitomeya imitator]
MAGLRRKGVPFDIFKLKLAGIEIGRHVAFGEPLMCLNSGNPPQVTPFWKLDPLRNLSSWRDHPRKMLTWYDTSTLSSGSTGARSFPRAKYQGLNHYLLELKQELWCHRLLWHHKSQHRRGSVSVTALQESSPSVRIPEEQSDRSGTELKGLLSYSSCLRCMRPCIAVMRTENELESNIEASAASLEMDPVKVQAIHDWIRPTSVKSLQKFLGFANFYRRFIANFSSVVEVDASEIGAGAVLSQRNSDGSLRKQCAFFSPKEPANAQSGVLGPWAFGDLEGAKSEPSDLPGVDSVVDRLQQIWAHVVDNLVLSQEEAQRFANRRRISEIINPVSFRLALPASFAIHNVFHRSLLRKYVEPPVPSVDPPTPVLVDGELEYVVEKILDSRFSRRRLQYLVKWKGYGQEDNSWVSASDVHAADLVRTFHRAHPDRPWGSGTARKYETEKETQASSNPKTFASQKKNCTFTVLTFDVMLGYISSILEMTEEEQLALAVEMSQQEQTKQDEYTQEEEDELIKKAIQESLHSCQVPDFPISAASETSSSSKEEPHLSQVSRHSDEGLAKSPVVLLQRLSQDIVDSPCVVLSPNCKDPVSCIESRLQVPLSPCTSDFLKMSPGKDTALSPVFLNKPPSAGKEKSLSVLLQRLSQDIVENPSVILSPNGKDPVSCLERCLQSPPSSCTGNDFVKLSSSREVTLSPVFPQKFPYSHRQIPCRLFQERSQSADRQVDDLDVQHTHCSESLQMDSSPVLPTSSSQGFPNKDSVSSPLTKERACEDNVSIGSTEDFDCRSDKCNQSGGTVHYYWGVPFCPKGVDPSEYTKVILCQLEVYQKSLKNAQRQLLHKMDYGPPIHLVASSQENSKEDPQSNISQEETQDSIAEDDTQKLEEAEPEQNDNSDSQDVQPMSSKRQKTFQSPMQAVLENDHCSSSPNAKHNSKRCALLSSCSGCERRSAGKQSGDVTALLSGCPALTARPEKQSAEDRQQKHTNSPTHEDGNSLDLVFSRLCSVDDFTNSPLPLSDHNLLSFSIKNCHPAQVTPTFHTYRSIQAINTQKLIKNLQSSLAPIFSISCPDSALKHYNETLQSALDEAAPPIHKTTRHRRQQPWHTLQTRFLQRCSRCAERLWRKSNLPEDFIHYKFMLKTYNSALHLSKQTYFNTLITSLSNNLKRLFETFQSLLNPREQAPTTDLRADDLANYFKEKIDHIRQEIISQSLHTMHCPPSPTASSSLSDFEAVTEEEAINISSQMFA